MIKVLVAEDELPLLRGISRLIEGLDKEFQVVMMAKTGKEALNYLKQHSVDIVFTDINMPVVGGLEVLKYISQNKPQILSAIISGYQEFSYARRAMQYGAKNYLIKPVDKEELSLLLEQLKESLASRMTNKKSRIIEEILYGKSAGLKHKNEESQEAAFGPEFHKIYPVYLIARAYCSHSMEEEVFNIGFWQDIRMIEHMQEELPQIKAVYTNYGKNPNEMMLLLELEEEADIIPSISKALSKNETGVPIAWAAGGGIEDLADVRKCMKQLQEAICMNWIYGNNEQVETDRKLPSFYISKTTEEALKYMVRNGKSKNFQTTLKDIQKQMQAEQITQYDLELTLNKIVLFIQIYRNMFESVEIENMSFEINDMVVRASSLEEVFDEFIFWCHDMMFSKNEENTEILVRRLDYYIQEHYTKRLSMKLLAGEFGLVPSYLSKLFRDYKGITPNHYLQEIRIERAKELLLSCPSMMTKDIALTVGYTDPSYFSKAFKKSTNMYPSEYRMVYQE